MRRSESVLALLALGLFAGAFNACASKKADSVQTCPSPPLESREQRFVVVDLTDGGVNHDAATDQDACVVDCPGVTAPDPFTDAASCGPPCMEAVRGYGYDDPRLVGCHESSVSIGCTFDVRVIHPCDPVGP